MIDKEKIRTEIFKIINRFYLEYKLPPMNITDSEWDTFLDVIESHFLAHNNIDEYEYAINILIRRALNFASINSEKEFTINHLLKALQDLSVFYISEDEIIAMKEEIYEKVKKYKK